MSSGSTMTTTFTAEVDREDSWWTIHILELDVVSQAAHWSEVEEMARGVIVAMLDVEEDAELELEIVPVFDDEAGRLLQQAEEWEALARDLAAAAGDAKRAAVQTLKSAGWTLQGIAAGIGLSYQRVEQLLKGADPGQPQTAPPAKAQSQRAAPGRTSITPSREAPVANRSAKTGRYISNAAAARHPRTSVREAGRNRSSATAYRSATSGRYVTKSTAKRDPKGTVTENR